MEKLHAVRGMNDILPTQTAHWQRLEQVLRGIFSGYGYTEIRLPLLESTALFERSIGAATDIVEKEMYTFTDRGGDSLTLRPEGTAGVVRAGIQHALFRNRGHRLWYMGPMFRRERPQRGRYRQFYQAGVEAFGIPGPDIDAELIIMTARLWRELGLNDLRLEINTLGNSDTRQRYRDDLIEYFSAHMDLLDADSKRRLQKNPLRILDTKNLAMAELVANAPTFQSYLDTESAAHFDEFQSILEKNQVAFEVNARLVRGLDYYNRTVFEWITTELGAQGTVCGGGRYDGLIGHFGSDDTPAVGFALGLDRLVEMLQDTEVSADPHAYLIAVGDGVVHSALGLAERLRDAVPELRLQCHCGGGSFKSQFKRADRSGATLGLVLGPDEVAARTVTVKHLRTEMEQLSLSQDAVAGYLSELLGLALSDQA